MSAAKLITRASGVDASCLLKCTSAYFCLSVNTLVGFLYRKGIVCHRVVPSLCASHGSPSGQVPMPSRCRPVASSGRIRRSVKPGKLLDKQCFDPVVVHVHDLEAECRTFEAIACVRNAAEL